MDVCNRTTSVEPVLETENFEFEHQFEFQSQFQFEYQCEFNYQFEVQIFFHVLNLPSPRVSSKRQSYVEAKMIAMILLRQTSQFKKFGKRFRIEGPMAIFVYDHRRTHRRKDTEGHFVQEAILNKSVQFFRSSLESELNGTTNILSTKSRRTTIFQRSVQSFSTTTSSENGKTISSNLEGAADPVNELAAVHHEIQFSLAHEPNLIVFQVHVIDVSAEQFPVTFRSPVIYRICPPS
ncbi:unnamed protein product [Nesidiocoris tenuis]|uniref:Uncharacterized protein n=1 Tax=Nesidiocoris tenuis TaxID=355587 RepID=A0A6H5H8C1_9HEMI|nr:unnamed protein product [Nesidiocoris tenuis]